MKNFTSLKDIKTIPPIILLKLISKAKEFLKKDDTWKQMCEEYDENVDIIDVIPVKFDNLDVSAKTDHGIVILNYKLLLNNNFEKNYSYLIHEFKHWFQQCYGEKPTKGSNDGDYLDNPYEQEAFQEQVSFIADNLGDDAAEDYVDNLLEYHEVDDKKDKKDELMSKV